MRAAHLFILIIVFSIVCLPASAQKKGIRYVKESELSKGGLRRVNVWYEHRVGGKEHRFNKEIDYETGNAYNLDLDVYNEAGNLQLWKNTIDSTFGFYSDKYDTVLHRNFSIFHNLKNDLYGFESGYITENEEGDTMRIYRLSQDVIEYYDQWAQGHIDSADLIVIPPWPDTKNCELLTSEYTIWIGSVTADTMITWTITEKYSGGIAHRDSLFVKNINKAKSVTADGMQVEASMRETSNDCYYSTVHYNDPPDSTWQFRYYTQSGDTLWKTTMISNLVSDTIYYQLSIQGHHPIDLNIYDPSRIDKPYMHQFLMRRNSKLQMIDAVAIGESRAGEPVFQIVGTPKGKTFYTEILTFSPDTKMPTKDLISLEWQNLPDLKPLIVLPRVEYKPDAKSSKKAKRNARRYNRKHRPKNRNGKKYFKRVEIDRKARYEKWVRKENPELFYEVYYN